MRGALFLGAITALVACGAPQLPNATDFAPNSARGSSWIEAQAQGHDLLYVSDQGGSVYVFSYPDGKLVGGLTGFQGPGGLCSDTAGDVYVVDTPREAVLEYKHGATEPTRLVGTSGYPEGCAVDSRTGDLAVTIYQMAPSGSGSVSIYAHAQSRRSTTYTDPSFNAFFFCGYDDKGDLYVDGVDSGTTQTEFAQLRRGARSLQDFTLDKNVGYPGGIQWDGSDVALEDLSTDSLYRVKVTGRSGRVIATTHFDGDNNTLLTQFWIQNGTIVLPYGRLARSAHRVGLWQYPAGGSPENVLQPRGAVELVGATVSLH